MIEVEVRQPVPGVEAPADVLCRALAALGVERASVSVMVVSPPEMAEINARHRDKPTPTDVLSFPLDGEGLESWPEDGPDPELGDIVLCPETASDPLDELLIHGLLHLLGYDHETDDGQMLERQAELVALERQVAAPG